MLPTHGVSWIDRKLFSGSGRKSCDELELLPRVEPHEVPHTETSDYAFGSLTPVLAALLPESETRRESLKKELMKAGFHRPHAWHNLAAFRYLAIMLPMILFGGLLVIVPAQAEAAVLGMLVIISLLGWALPRWYVWIKASHRTGEIKRAMPAILTMPNMCVSQEIKVPNALKRVSQELRSVYPDLARELNIVCEQAEVWNLRHALENFSERIDVPDVHAFTSLLIQTEQMGTSVSTALTEYSDNIRETLRQRADEKATQATFKLLFPTVLCLMPAVYLFLLGPAVVELSDFFHGGGRDLLNSGRQAVEELNR
jgi:tight adherence protein C